MEVKHDTHNKRKSDLPTVLVHCVERGTEILSSAEHKYYSFFASQFDWPYLH